MYIYIYIYIHIVSHYDIQVFASSIASADAPADVRRTTLSVELGPYIGRAYYAIHILYIL